MSSQHSISIGEHLTRVGQRYDEHKQLLRRQHELAERRAAPFTPLITRFAERARRRSQSRPLTEWTNTLEPPPMSEWARVSDEKGCRAGHEAVHRETHHTLRTGENAPIGDRLYNLAMRHASREPRQSTPSRLEDASMAARTDHIPHVTRRAHELVRDGHVVSSSERWRQQREVNRALAVAAARVAEMREVRDTPQITAFATRRRRRGATASTPTAATSTASARTTSRGGAQTRWRTRLQERSVSLGHRTSGGSRGQGTKAAHTAPLFVSTKGRHEDRKAHLGEERAKKTEEEEQQQQQQQQPATGSPPRRRPPPPHTLFSGRRLRPECAVSHRAGHRSASGCDGRSANSTVRIGTRAATTRAADDDTRRAPNAAQKPSRDNGQSSRQETDAPGGTGGRRCRGGARQSWTDWPVPYSSQKNEASVHVDSCAAAAAAAAADGANSLAIEVCEETDDRTPACTPPHVDRADEPSVSRCVTPPPPPPPPPPRVCESPGMSGRAVAVSRGATTTPGARGGNGIVCVEEAHTTRARVSRETVRESPSTRLHRHGRVSQDKTDPTSDTSATYRPCINPTSEMLWRRRVRLLAAPHRIAPRRAAAAAAAAVGTSRQDGDSAEDAAHESNADTVYVMADDEEEEEEDDDDVYRGRRRGAAVSVAQELLWREAEKKREARVQRAHDAQRVAERQSCTFHPCVSGRQSRPRLRGDDWTPPHTQQQHPHPHSHLQTQQQQQQQQHKQQTQPTSGAWGKETCRRRVGLSFDARAAVWQSQRSRRLRSLADELEQAELAECTFQPRIQHYFPLPNQPLMRHSTGNNAHEDGKVRRTRSSSSSGGGHHHLGDVYCSHDAPSLANQSQNNVNIRHSYSGNDDEYIHACDENYDVGAYEDGLETSQAPHAKASDAKRNSRADGLSGVWAHVRRLRAAQQQRAEDALWWLPRKQRARASHVTLAHNDVNQLVYGRGHAVKPVSRQQSLLCLSSRSTCPSVRVVTSYDAMGGNPVEEDAVGPGSFCSNRVARRQLDTPSSWKSEEEDRDGGEALTDDMMAWSYVPYTAYPVPSVY